jgi:Protein of unknown function (DUF3467)
VSGTNIHISPPSDAGGSYADFVVVWQTDETFVLDFAAMTGPPTPADEEGEDVVNAQIVTRVRIPPAQVFEIMKALEQQLTQWEERTGNTPDRT